MILALAGRVSLEWRTFGGLRYGNYITFTNSEVVIICNWTAEGFILLKDRCSYLPQTKKTKKIPERVSRNIELP